MHVIVPIKRFDLAKQRLAPAATARERASLAHGMAEKVLRELAAARRHDGVLVVSGERKLRALAMRLGFDYLDDPGGGLNPAVAAAMTRAIGGGATDIAIVHADLPLFSAGEFDRIAARHQAGPARGMTLVPDMRDDGTNVRFCRPAGAVPPLYGPGSALRHCAYAAAQGLAVERVHSPALSFDCDTPVDLRRIASLAQGGARTVFAQTGIVT